MNAFITGITGFVGAGLARGLLQDGAQVHGLVRPSSNRWRLANIEEQLTLHEGDLLDKESMRSALRAAHPDVIFHLGVYGAYPHQADRETIMKSSLLSTVVLLGLAKESGIGMVVNTGSSSEYGAKNHPMREDDFLAPDTCYAVAKAAQTLYCQQFSREEKLPVITLRLFSVYGPFEEPTRFMPTLIRNVLANRDMPLADPRTARDFIYLDDVVAAYRAAAAKPELGGEIFNVGTGVQHTLREAFDMAVSLAGSSSKPLIGEYENRRFDRPHWVADIDRMRSRLGVSPRYTLSDGLSAMIEWVKTNDTYEQ